MAAALTTVTHGAVATIFEVYGLPPLTIAFVIVAVIFVLLQGSISGVVPVEITNITTPEGHLRRLYKAKQQARDLHPEMTVMSTPLVVFGDVLDQQEPTEEEDEDEVVV